ncbi:hypothetical protein HDV04_004439 [Boothiomyces sp. JEL0838]|nr:hypothetical protein HDV04_004439 [Boothiomyces sp. JEL0838]
MFRQSSIDSKGGPVQRPQVPMVPPPQIRPMNGMQNGQPMPNGMPNGMPIGMRPPLQHPARGSSAAKLKLNEKGQPIQQPVQQHMQPMQQHMQPPPQQPPMQMPPPQPVQNQMPARNSPVSRSSDNSPEQERISFSTMDFFDRFVRPANEKGLLRTPLPTPISRSHIRASSIQLLQAARLESHDVSVQDDNYGGIINLTNNGLNQIIAFLVYKQQAKAATTIQKHWRGYSSRKKTKQLNKKPSREIETDRLLYLEQYVNEISILYDDILHAQRNSNNAAPSNNEIIFMKKLNNPETYRVCNDFLNMIAEFEDHPQMKNQRMTVLPGTMEYQNTMMMYMEYAPKVLAWISNVLHISFKPNEDLLFILRSGDILCRLACTLYQRVECHLLDKSLEYGIHKIIFFLELCKSLHIKRALLFKVSDLLVWPDADPHKKSALIVLRTVIALEKHARKSGWQGPTIDLKAKVSLDLGVSSRESVLKVASQEFQPRQGSPSASINSTESKNGANVSRTPSNLAINKPTFSLPEIPEVSAQISAHMDLSPAAQAHDYSDISSDEEFEQEDKESVADTEISHLMNAASIADKKTVPVPSKEVEEMQDPQKVLQDAIRQRIKHRTQAIEDFIGEEETYVGNLSNVADYLNTLIKQRRRLSNVMPAITDEEKKNIPMPQNFSLSGSSLHPLPNESDRAYKFRLETEIEEIQKLHGVIQGMVNIHGEFVENLKSSWSENANTFIVGPSVSAFSAAIHRPYSTYAVVALSGTHKTHLTLTTRGEVEQSEFVNRIVNKYVVSSLNSEPAQEPSAQDWSWYLSRPIHRLSSYPHFLSIIHGETKVRLHPLVDTDNKKLRISSIKFECIAMAIKEHLGTS